MRRTLLTAAAVLALGVPAGIAMAQDTVVATDAAGNVYVMTDVQRGMYDAWPVDRRTSYDGWPNDYKVYYWTLTPEQQGGWWVLNDDQRTRVHTMTPEQRTAAWTSIMAQMSGAPASASTSTSADASMSTSASSTMTADASMSSSTMTSGNIQFVRREVAQPVAGSADAAALQSGDLPVCTPNQQDGCINSWEKNRTGTRPLNYWPGKPASEIPGPKPQG